MLKPPFSIDQLIKNFMLLCQKAIKKLVKSAALRRPFMD